MTDDILRGGEVIDGSGRRTRMAAARLAGNRQIILPQQAFCWNAPLAMELARHLQGERPPSAQYL